jgi:predicted enzyme related to lactoylglutathione lyase
MNAPTLTMVTLHVRNLDRAMAFYRDTLGLPEGDHVPAVKWAEFKLGSVMLGLHENDTESGHRPPGGSSGFYLSVSNVDEYLRVAEKKGAKIGDKPQEFPYGRVGTLLDPDGNELMFLEPPKA